MDETTVLIGRPPTPADPDDSEVRFEGAMAEAEQSDNEWDPLDDSPFGGFTEGMQILLKKNLEDQQHKKDRREAKLQQELERLSVDKPEYDSEPGSGISTPRGKPRTMTEDEVKRMNPLTDWYAVGRHLLEDKVWNNQERTLAIWWMSLSDPGKWVLDDRIDLKSVVVQKEEKFKEFHKRFYALLHEDTRNAYEKVWFKLNERCNKVKVEYQRGVKMDPIVVKKLQEAEQLSEEKKRKSIDRCKAKFLSLQQREALALEELRRALRKFKVELTPVLFPLAKKLGIPPFWISKIIFRYNKTLEDTPENRMKGFNEEHQKIWDDAVIPGGAEGGKDLVPGLYALPWTQMPCLVPHNINPKKLLTYQKTEEWKDL